jgi:hypothetical protein
MNSHATADSEWISPDNTESYEHALEQSAADSTEDTTFEPTLEAVNIRGTDETPEEFFTIEEDKSPFFQPQFQSPQMMLQNAARQASKVLLTKWLKHGKSPELPKEKYNRKKHFGTWLSDPYDNTCFNTRAKILIRDSKKPVKFKANNKCVVEKGLWNDPYTGEQINEASEIQIDHVVPLKHAYQTGAWKWSAVTRCSFSNFMANDYHLKSVDARQNMKKSDKSPDDYMPPNNQYACSYLKNWLQIKLTWKLVIFPEEAEAIQGLITQFQCNKSEFAMNKEQVRTQRQQISELFKICEKRMLN